MRRLLVVDDDSCIQGVISAVFRNQYDVTAVGTVLDAVCSCQRIVPDIIIMDINLPDGNGFEALERIRAMGRTGFAIIVSCVDVKYRPASQTHWERLRIFDTADKPFDVDLLQYQVKSAVELQESEIALREYLEEVSSKTKARVQELHQLVFA